MSKKSYKSKGGFDPAPAPAPAPVPDIDPVLAPELKPVPGQVSLKSIREDLIESEHIVKNIQVHVNYQTIMALALALIYVLTHLMVFDNTNMSYYYILLLIFIWPTIIEILSRHLQNMSIIMWILSILPITIILSYEGYRYYNNGHIRRLKKIKTLLKKENKELRKIRY